MTEDRTDRCDGDCDTVTDALCQALAAFHIWALSTPGASEKVKINTDQRNDAP